MIFESFQLQVRADIATGSYLIGDEESRKAAWIDPAVFDEEVIETIDQYSLKIKYILLTHGHYDHTGGIAQAIEKYQCLLVTHQDDALSNVKPVKFVQEGDRLPLGNQIIEVFETKGHTPGSVTYRIGNYLFVGDALFAGSVGGTTNHESFLEQKNALLEKVLTIGEDLIICPGHGPMSMAGVEKRFNPFLD